MRVFRSVRSLCRTYTDLRYRVSFPRISVLTLLPFFSFGISQSLDDPSFAVTNRCDILGRLGYYWLQSTIPSYKSYMILEKNEQGWALSSYPRRVLLDDPKIVFRSIFPRAWAKKTNRFLINSVDEMECKYHNLNSVRDQFGRSIQLVLYLLCQSKNVLRLWHSMEWPHTTVFTTPHLKSDKPFVSIPPHHSSRKEGCHMSYLFPDIGGHDVEHLHKISSRRYPSIALTPKEN